MNDARPTLQQRILAVAANVAMDPTSSPEDVSEARAVIARAGRALDLNGFADRIAELPAPTVHRLRDLVREIRVALGDQVETG